MIVLSERSPGLFRVEFEELYQRHLCRHSQFGINVIHLIALFGAWYSLYGLIHWLSPFPWGIFALGTSFLVLAAPNLPVRVLLMTLLFVASVCTTAYVAKIPWVWVYPMLFLAFYKIQGWSHQIYTVEHDMTIFNNKYRPGKLLFLILLIYEVPIVLNYLINLLRNKD